ncbi:MAG: MiaB/RimO family radical SAM methylthiotransferase [Candidatus Saganbacteria bacterium]|nr:MiaB/RimO family radical SAM methylthiotransferase [Candidatus Saganbacteria bacterium]
MKAYIISLGCPKNLTDTEVLMGQLVASGHQITLNEKEADFFIINTCAFLKSARDEVKETIKELKKYKKDIFLAGCLPKWTQVPLAGTAGTIDSIKLYNHLAPRIKATPPWTAYVKIAEGCNNKCSYCLIPKIRGRLKTRAVSDIILEVKQLEKRGVKEIIYVAQDTTAHPKFAELLIKTAKISGIRWIRVMYAHPSHITDKLLKVMAAEKKICKYLDLPIQHISDNILEGMNRPLRRGSDIENLICKIREAIPGIIIRTSLIVGFPGEKDSDFKTLLDFVKRIKFDRLGVFKFSREDGTPASKMRGQVPEKVKDKRFQKIMAIQKKISRTLNKNRINEKFEVLCEGKRGSYFIGRTYMSAPGIDGLVKLKHSGSSRYGRFVHAKVVSASAYDLTASVIT